MRNTKIVDVIKSLNEYGVEVIVYDPWQNHQRFYRNMFCNCKCTACKKIDSIFGLLIKNLWILYNALRQDNSVLYDVKGVLGKIADGKLIKIAIFLLK